MCGLGGFVQFIAAVICEISGKKAGERKLWISMIVLLPLLIFAICFNFTSDADFMLLLAAFSAVCIQLVCVSAGMWVGRLSAGRCRDKKQFYIEDKFYMASILITAALFVINYSISNDKVYTGVAIVVLSAVYGFFSGFDYVQDKLVRAMMTTYMIFCAVALYLVIGKKTESDIDAAVVFAYIAAVSAMLSAMGVLIGYYLRIMKFGGDKEYSAEERKNTIKRCFAALFLAIIAVIVINIRFFLYRQVSVWDCLGVDENDIKAIEFNTDAVYTEQSETYFTIHKEGIKQITDILKTEKGAKIPSYSVPYKKWITGYSLKAYDDKGEELFNVSMSYEGELLTDTSDEWGNFILPLQYYGLSEIKKSEYERTIKNAVPAKTEEKVEYIKGMYTDVPRGFSRFAVDKDKAVRLAAIEKLGECEKNYEVTDILKMTVFYHDDDVRAAVYKVLAKQYMAADAADLRYIADNEYDEKYRFFAMNYLAEKIAAYDQWYNEWKDDAFIYIHGKYMNALTDLDKLTYTCAMVNLGKVNYAQEAEELLARIPDTDEYADIRNYAREIIKNAR